MSQIALPLDASPEALSPTLNSPTGELSPQRDLSALRDAAPVLRERVPGVALPTGFEAEGFRIGWEHARYLTTPPADHLHAGHPVRQGWEAGRVAFAGRTLAATRAARLWLALRLQAWLRGRDFEEFMVTPRYVAQMDVRVCPVTQVALTCSSAGHDSASDAVLMPLCERAACAAGNLAVVSSLAAQARAALGPQDMADVLRRLAAGEAESVAGLDLAAWRRLQALTSLATPLSHAQAAAQPLHVLPPPRVHLLNPVQALQTLLTLVFTAPGYARQLTGLGTLMPHAQARRAYYLFMNAMLARRLSARGAAPREQLRKTMEQAWSHPLVQQRWLALALTLTPAQADRVARLAIQRGGVGSEGTAWRWMDNAAATQGWGLDVTHEGFDAASLVAVSQAASAPGSGPARARRPHHSASGAGPRGGVGRPTAPHSPARRHARGSA